MVPAFSPKRSAKKRSGRASISFSSESQRGFILAPALRWAPMFSAVFDDSRDCLDYLRYVHALPARHSGWSRRSVAPIERLLHQLVHVTEAHQHRRPRAQEVRAIDLV